jgi:hypothetical protein
LPLTKRRCKNNPLDVVRLKELVTVPLGLSCVDVAEAATMDKAHVKGPTGGTADSAQGRTITPREMTAGRKADAAKQRQQDNISSGCRLPARSAKNEPPPYF